MSARGRSHQLFAVPLCLAASFSYVAASRVLLLSVCVCVCVCVFVPNERHDACTFLLPQPPSPLLQIEQQVCAAERVHGVEGDDTSALKLRKSSTPPVWMAAPSAVEAVSRFDVARFHERERSIPGDDVLQVSPHVLRVNIYDISSAPFVLPDPSDSAAHGPQTNVDLSAASLASALRTSLGRRACADADAAHSSSSI